MPNSRVGTVTADITGAIEAVSRPERSAAAANRRAVC
jgi:ribosomal protein L1